MILTVKTHEKYKCNVLFLKISKERHKCRYPKKFTCKGTLRQVFYLYESPPPYTTYCIRVYYCILIHTGKGGVGGELNREKVRGAIVHEAGRQYQHD